MVVGSSPIASARIPGPRASASEGSAPPSPCLRDHIYSHFFDETKRKPLTRQDTTKRIRHRRLRGITIPSESARNRPYGVREDIRHDIEALRIDIQDIHRLRDKLLVPTGGV